jgi:hypothetical protein
MIALINLERPIEEARNRGLVVTAADEELYRHLETEYRKVKSKGGTLQIPPGSWF